MKKEVAKIKDTDEFLKKRGVIQKSKPLLAIQKNHLSLLSYKLLDTYLGVIDSHQPEGREVVIMKSQIEKMTHVERIRIETLNQAVRELMKPLSFWYDLNEKVVNISLFEETSVEKDGNSYKITLVCTEAAKKYFFNVETIGYLKYRLADVMNFQSSYSYLLYLYVKDMVSLKKGSSWRVDIDSLKQALDSEGMKSDMFNMNVVKRAETDVNKRTNLHFSCEAIKDGRDITKYEFRILNSYIPRTTEKKYRPKTEAEEARREAEKLKRALAAIKAKSEKAEEAYEDLRQAELEKELEEIRRKKKEREKEGKKEEEESKGAEG